MRRLLVCPALLFAAACSQPAADARPAADPAVATASSTSTSASASTTPAPAPPSSGRGRRAEVVNNARHGGVARLEVAPVEDREAFREVVAARGLAAGAEKTVAIGPGCAYDMRAVMADGTLLRQYRVDICFRDRVFLLDWPAEGEPPMAGGPEPQ